MRQSKQSLPSAQLVACIVDGMREKKAKDLVILDLREIQQSVSDYFVIATGTADTHVDAIQRSVQEAVYKSHQERPWHTEGTENNQWVLLDFVDVVVHVFQEPKRNFYQLEELWGDARIIPVSEAQPLTEILA